MPTLKEWLARFWGSLRRRRSDGDINAELHAHLDLAREDALRRGHAPDAAHRRATIAAGGVAQAAESMRDQRGLPWLDDFLRDTRYAFRVLRRAPGFTIAAGAALALGIGVNTAVFTAYRAAVLRPLDASDPDRLVNLALLRQSGGANISFSHPDYEAYRDTVPAFGGVAAFLIDRLTLTGAGETIAQHTSAAASSLGRLGLLTSAANNVEFATTDVVSENYFRVLGIPATRGRTFDAISPEEMRASPPAMISENYWQRRFGGDPAIIGTTVRLNGVPVTIVGVTPKDFIGASVAVPAFWLPLQIAPEIHANAAWLTDRENEKLRVFARLAPGATLARAQAEANVVAGRLRTLHDPKSDAAKPATLTVWRGSPFPLPLDQYPGLLLAIRLIMAAALMVLVVACANVASLQLARARARQTELVTRLSLGASRFRVLRQLLTESLLLGLVSGVGALAVTSLILKALVQVVADAAPPDFGTIVFDVTPDLSIFAFVCAISIAAGVIFGLMPAIESTRTSLVAADRASTLPARSRRLQNALVGAQVALSLVLLIAGSLLIRSAVQAVRANPGYDAARVISVSLQFPDTLRYGADRKDALVRDLQARLGAMPGVASITSAQPPGFAFVTAVVDADAAPAAAPRRSVDAYSLVQPNYFETIGVPLRAGPGFSTGTSATPRVIVSESAARDLWPGENPLGRHVRLGAIDEKPHAVGELTASGAIYEVVDVARDTRGSGLTPNDSRMIYLQRDDRDASARPLLVRTASDPDEVLRALPPAIAAVDKDLIVTASTLDDQLKRSGPFVIAALSAIVATTVGAIGLVLAAMGIFGTVSFIVARRTREVGIRMAIGASRREILAMILRESARPVVVGLVVGATLAIGVSYLLRNVLYGVSRVDGVSFVGVSALFLLLALAAALPPARRATRVEPVVALRDS